MNVLSLIDFIRGEDVCGSGLKKYSNDGKRSLHNHLSDIRANYNVELQLLYRGIHESPFHVTTTEEILDTILWWDVVEYYISESRDDSYMFALKMHDEHNKNARLYLVLNTSMSTLSKYVYTTIFITDRATCMYMYLEWVASKCSSVQLEIYKAITLMSRESDTSSPHPYDVYIRSDYTSNLHS